MFKMRRYLDLKTLFNLYHTYIYHTCTYIAVRWGNTAAVHLDPVIKLQKYVRTLTFLNYLLPTSPIFKKTLIY